MGWLTLLMPQLRRINNLWSFCIIWATILGGWSSSCSWWCGKFTRGGQGLVKFFPQAKPFSHPDWVEHALPKIYQKTQPLVQREKILPLAFIFTIIFTIQENSVVGLAFILNKHYGYQDFEDGKLANWQPSMMFQWASGRKWSIWVHKAKLSLKIRLRPNMYMLMMPI